MLLFRLAIPAYGDCFVKQESLQQDYFLEIEILPLLNWNIAQLIHLAISSA